MPGLYTVHPCIWCKKYVTKVFAAPLPVPCHVWNELQPWKHIFISNYNNSSKVNPTNSEHNSPGFAQFTMAVNCLSSHTFIESMFITQPLSILHPGNVSLLSMETCEVINSYLRAFKKLLLFFFFFLLKLTAYSWGPIRGSHLDFTNFHFSSQRNPSGLCQHSHAWKRLRRHSHRFSMGKSQRG